MLEHLGNRAVLNMDQLAEMTDVRPRLEKEMRLPGDARGARNRIYFFSIDGTIRGNRFTGCLAMGECIMVQTEKGFSAALKLAKDGLHDTLEIAKEYFDELNKSVVVASPLDHSHIAVEAGGRRKHHLPQQPDLATDPKLKAMIGHLIGKKPWRG